jgi:hypothetical protein
VRSHNARTRTSEPITELFTHALLGIASDRVSNAPTGMHIITIYVVPVYSPTAVPGSAHPKSDRPAKRLRKVRCERMKRRLRSA